MTLLVSSTLISQSILDLDFDGMDDQWEVDNGLNPADSSDRWLDFDQDYVINLFEFQLNTDPNDAATPNVVTLKSTDNFDNVVDNAPDQSVIRMHGGIYNVAEYYNTNFTVAKQVMFQGGWSSDFTSFDPCTEQTTLQGDQSSDVLDFFYFEGPKSAIILEGLEITNAGGAAVLYDSGSDTAYFSMRNCLIHQNIADYFSSVVGITSGGDTKESRYLILNTQIVNNEGTGLAVDHFGLGGTFEMIHNIVGYNKQVLDNDDRLRGGHGLELAGFSAVDSLVRVRWVNAIFWGNEGEDIEVGILNEEAYQFENSNNIFSAIDSSLFFSYQMGPGEADVDPLFEDPENGDFSLQANSPAIGSGQFLNYPGQMEGSVNMGVLPCSELATSVQSSLPLGQLYLQVYPTVNQGQFSLEVMDFDGHEKGHLELYNQLGELLYQQEIYLQSEPQFINVVKSVPLVSGNYWLKVKGERFVGHSAVVFQQ